MEVWMILLLCVVFGGIGGLIGAIIQELRNKEPIYPDEEDEDG